MKIGLTYDLRDDYLRQGYSKEETAEFDSQETIQALEEALTHLGHTPERIGNVFALMPRLATGERWDLVFNIAEGMYGLGREAQVPCLLDAYRIPYTFSDPLVLALTLHKGITKALLSHAGIPTPAFAVVQNAGDIQRVTLDFPLFAKPVAEGTGKGITSDSYITSPGALERVCRRLLEEFRQPVLLERFLPGREFTAGVTGTGEAAQVVGVMEIVYRNDATGIYSYETKARYQELVTYRLPETAIGERCTQVALDTWRTLGCRDGGRIDLRLDEAGVPNVLEINPLAGLHPVHSDLPIIGSLTGLSYHALIGRIMDSAGARISSRS